MTLRYQLTYEDFREAHFGARATKPARRKVGALLGWVLFIGLAVVLFMFLSNTSPQRTAVSRIDPPHVPASEPARLAAAVVPAFLIGLLIALQSVRSTRPSARKPWDPPPAHPRSRQAGSNRNLLVGVLFIGVTMTLVFLLSHAAARARAAGEPSLRPFDFLVGVVPLATMFIVLLAVNKLAGDTPVERSWKMQTLLQRPTTVEVTESAITFIDETSRHECTWSQFQGYKETQNLFVLYPSPLSLNIIPKRGFPEGDTDMVRFRAWVLSGIPSGYFLEKPPSAFPVVPMAVRAPEVA